MTVPDPDLFWYHMNGMGAKKIFTTYSIIILSKNQIIKLRILQKQKSFQETNTFPQRHRILNYLELFVQLPQTNLNKTVCPELKESSKISGIFLLYKDLM